MFRIERRGPDYLVQWVSGVAIYPCEGCGRNRDSEAALALAIERDIESGMVRLAAGGAVVSRDRDSGRRALLVTRSELGTGLQVIEGGFSLLGEVGSWRTLSIRGAAAILSAL